MSLIYYLKRDPKTRGLWVFVRDLSRRVGPKQEPAIVGCSHELTKCCARRWVNDWRSRNE